MASDHGPEAHSGRRSPLGQIHYLAQIRLGLELDCLGAKSPLSIYINRGRAAGVSHHVFRVDLGLFYPCLVGAALSRAPSRRLGSGPRALLFLYSIQQCSAIHRVQSPLPVTVIQFSEVKKSPHHF
jgi:hypothetical protein